MKEIICDFCGKKGFVYKYRLVRSKKHFCSRECRYKDRTLKKVFSDSAVSFQKGHIPWNKGITKTKNCLFCKKDFKANYKIDKGRGKKFCSKICYGKSKIGIPLSEEIRKKIGKKHKGIRHTDETKKKLNLSSNGIGLTNIFGLSLLIR